MDSKKRAAIVRYLEKVGYDVVTSDFDGYIIAYDEAEETLVIINIAIGDAGVECGAITKEEFEYVILKYLASNDDYLGCSIRFDIINLILIKDDKAVLRHHIKADWKE